MAIYDKWDGHPHTDKRAAPRRWRTVEHARAIRVHGGTYRGCPPIDGVFELLSEPTQSRGSLRAEVQCGWHGAKPPTCFPHLIIEPGRFEIIASYSGEVIDDIGDATGPPSAHST